MYMCIDTVFLLTTLYSAEHLIGLVIMRNYGTVMKLINTISIISMY